jgi:hypothetical protein
VAAGAGRWSARGPGPLSNRRTTLLTTLAGLIGAAAVVGTTAAFGLVLGRAPAPAWVCDDTRYVDTVPLGRAVVGPSVAAPPGCGP